jgi:TniQ
VNVVSDVQPEAESLIGRVWPAFTPPREDELLSSWLVRLARNHGIKLQSFCNVVWPQRGNDVWTRDIDRFAHLDILREVSVKTAQSETRVRQTMIASYEGFLLERHTHKTNLKWILPLGIRSTIRTRPGVQFCPSCLAEDEDPYFRRHWRLALFSYCSKHRRLLLNRCPECGSPIMYYRGDMTDRRKYAADPMNICAGCGNNLGRVERCQGDLQQVAFPDKYLVALTTGFVEVAPGYPVHSFFYFDVLHGIVGVLASGRNSQRFRRLACEAAGVNEFSPEFNGKDTEFEYLSPLDRHRLLGLAEWLLEDWPNRFVDFCRSAEITKSSISRNIIDPPYWFGSVVTAHLYRPNYTPSIEEQVSVLRFLEKNGITPTAEAMRHFLGWRGFDARKGLSFKEFVKRFADPKAQPTQSLALPFKRQLTAVRLRSFLECQSSATPESAGEVLSFLATEYPAFRRHFNKVAGYLSLQIQTKKATSGGRAYCVICGEMIKHRRNAGNRRLYCGAKCAKRAGRELDRFTEKRRIPVRDLLKLLCLIESELPWLNFEFEQWRQVLTREAT